MGDEIMRAAGFSGCRTWRYWLARTWAVDRAPLVVIGLNPSTADETADDPTIRRCIDFARRWGHGGLTMLNLFAFRSTDPRGLRRAFDPVGPQNDTVLRSATEGRRVLCAWGAHGSYMDRNAVVAELLADRDLVCLGQTKDGHPRHPLYMRADTPPVAYSATPAPDAMEARNDA